MRSDWQRRQEETEALLAAEREARARVERTLRMKEEFMAIFGHELRTPLAAILGWAQLMQRDPDLPPRHEQPLKAIIRNSRALAQLVDDLMDTKRASSGKIRLSLAPIQIGKVISGALASIRPAADAKGIDVSLELDPELPTLRGDAGRLQQVFWNLLSNAVKFTPGRGRIDIRAEREGDAVRVAVTDSGMGIEPEFLPRIFDRYGQSGNTVEHESGLGLGLAIVKQLVEMHGGRVHAESAGKGAGATFVVQLPDLSRDENMAQANGMPAGRDEEATTHRGLNGLRILAVDDDADARALVKQILVQFGAAVDAVESAQDALESLDRSRYDLLLSDIGMPQINGYELVRRLRARPPDKGGQMPAIAFSAFVRAEDKARAEREGYQGYVTKPVEVYELVRVIRKVIGNDADP